MKIVVISSYTPSLFLFRLDMMKAFIKQGYDVIALGPDDEEKWEDKFKEHNIQYKSIYLERSGTSIINDLKTYKSIKKRLKEIKSDKVFSYHPKPVIYGSIAAHHAGVNEIYALVAGLGSVFRGEGLKNKIIKTIMKLEYKYACKNCNYVFFQNKDDQGEFINNKIVNYEDTFIINGSGVNTEKFKVADMPEKEAFLFIGRLIKDKGLIEYLEACKIIKSKYKDIRCMLVGPFDTNPSSIKQDELEPYIKDKTIEYFGEQEDVRPYIEQCSTFVLPSYHEGTPKTVLESMSMGRAIITTDAPGCRETVINEKNGFLVKTKDVDDLVQKMELIIKNKDLSKKMGIESRKIVMEKYDVNLVNESIMKAMNML